MRVTKRRQIRHHAGPVYLCGRMFLRAGGASRSDGAPRPGLSRKTMNLSLPSRNRNPLRLQLQLLPQLRLRVPPAGRLLPRRPWISPTPWPRPPSQPVVSHFYRAAAAHVSQRPHPSQPRPHPPQKSRPLMRNRKLSIRHCGQPRRRAGDLTRLSPLLKMAKTLTCPPLCAGNPKA